MKIGTMTEKHLNFLDFILPRLCKNYENGDVLSSLAEYYKRDTGNDFVYENIKPFQDLYDGVYFNVINNLGLVVITPEYKVIIDSHGSLSKYLQNLNHEKTKKTNKQNWVIIIPILIAVLMLFATIYFGISNDSKSKEILLLKQSVKKKDSIILELNNKIKHIDTLKIKH